MACSAGLQWMEESISDLQCPARGPPRVRPDRKAGCEARSLPSMVNLISRLVAGKIGERMRRAYVKGQVPQATRE